MIDADHKFLYRLGNKFTVGDGCWNWLRPNPNGYGAFRVGEHKVPAHRVLYELFKGPIPQGCQIDHLCKNRACVRPDHLEAVTPRENLLRSPTFQARNAAKTHCLRGHPFDAENTYVRPSDNGRICRLCERLRKSRG